MVVAPFDLVLEPFLEPRESREPFGRLEEPDVFSVIGQQSLPVAIRITLLTTELSSMAATVAAAATGVGAAADCGAADGCAITSLRTIGATESHTA